MKHLIFLCLLFACLSGFGQNKGARYAVDYCRFQNSFTDSPYVQIYLSLDGASVNYQQDKDNLFRPSVSGTMKIKRLENGDSSLVYFTNVVFEIPEQAGLVDTSLDSRKINMLITEDLRIVPGSYVIETEVTDHYSATPNRSLVFREFMIEARKSGEFAFSDIKWFAKKDNFNKKALGKSALVPMVTNDAFINQDSIKFYQEFYHADKLEALGDIYYVRSVIYQGNDRIFETQTVEHKVVSRAFNAYLERVYIAELRSNTYYLLVEILNRKGKLVKTYRKKFYVYNSRVESDFEAAISAGTETIMFNPYSEEQLDYYIKTLMYRSTEQEQNFARVLETPEQKKNFLYSFLEKRKTQPEQEIIALWKGHLAALEYVNKNFESAMREGWQTDRGRVFLQYGIPNDVERFPAESSLVPYEIWRYNSIGAQSNILFVFFDPDQALGEYSLLHSNKYGELNNPRWKSMLQNRGRVPTEVDFEKSNLDRIGNRDHR